MRSIVTVALMCVALTVGLSGPVAAAPPGPGVEATVERRGVLTGAELVAARQAARVAADAPCRWVERKRGRRTSKHGRWLMWIKVRLHWCYDAYEGFEVVSAKATFTRYSSNKRVWRWRGWSPRKLKHGKNYSSVTADAGGKFYYTGNGYTYRPFIIILGSFDGTYKTWQGN